MVKVEFYFILSSPSPVILQITYCTVGHRRVRWRLAVFLSGGPVTVSCQFYFAISYLLQRIMTAPRQQHANPVVQALLGAIAQQALPPQVEVK